MPYRVLLPRIDTSAAWRDSARDCLAHGLSPQDVSFSLVGDDRTLFDDPCIPGGPAMSQPPVNVPKSFVSLARTVVWHSDADRFDRLYALLCRVTKTPALMADRADPAIAHLRQMEKAVHRCQHKMKAFVRFREIGDSGAPRRGFAAWFEPMHNTVEPTAQFFARRFADMDWRIVTPSVSALFENGRLRFALDLPRPALPEDSQEELWTTYFRNIFNPARLKVTAMTAEMPKKYWKNLPEAKEIPQLVADAPARARAMAEAAPTQAPVRASRVQAAADYGTTWDGPQDAFGAALATCARCPLHRDATQVVPGCGPRQADLMIVGEQPGDHEDLAGQPFIGPSGRLLDDAFNRAGLQRDRIYLTNAVKHFKHEVRGKRRIHRTPNRSEVEHCRFWLNAEIRNTAPRVIVAMGATAAFAVTGDGGGILKRRGSIETGLAGLPVLITAHPAHILRTLDRADQTSLRGALAADLVRARSLCS